MANDRINDNDFLLDCHTERAPFIIRDMPIYEFECRKCKAHLEVFQKVSDKPPVKCRKCGGRLERKISAPAIQFKGSGWYVTDYASKEGSKATKGEKTESESSTEAKSEKTEKKSKDSSPAKKASPPKTSGD